MILFDFLSKLWCVRKLPHWRSTMKNKLFMFPPPPYRNAATKQECLGRLLSILNRGEGSTDRQTAKGCHIFFFFCILYPDVEMNKKTLTKKQNKSNNHGPSSHVSSSFLSSGAGRDAQWGSARVGLEVQGPGRC